MERRGLWYLALERFNLGNVAGITEKFDINLEKDPNQPPVPRRVRTSVKRGFLVDITTMRLDEVEDNILNAGFDKNLFKSAQVIAQEEFARKNCIISFRHVQDDEFTIDVCTDPVTNTTVGAVDYIIMKKYLYVNAIAVLQSVQGYGVGGVMLEKLKQICVVREKEMLLLALSDVIPWYEKQGFVVSADYGGGLGLV
ncbi:hypothetical protein HK100_011846 [Physocladia obscura]|uniref:N-acetyltransferase domain-containing protein n=1 Tax=Physocladia obscura TaxID=109957 RepID=A0AAD5XCY7_9FUNG|nr:hypothetical protein HK100_011846 [Physocladia obscura]